MTHQIEILAGARRYDGNKISVSCTCLRIPRAGRPRHEVIEARTLFPAADAKAAWRAWHEQQGVAV